MFTVRRRGPYVTISLALVLALLLSGTGQWTYSAPPPPTEKHPLAQTGLPAGLIPTELPLAMTMAAPTPAATPPPPAVPQSSTGGYPVYLPLVLRVDNQPAPPKYAPATNWPLPHYDLGNTRAKLDEVMPAIIPTVLWEEALSPDLLGGWTHGDGAWCQDIAADATSVYYAVWHRSWDEPNYSFILARSQTTGAELWRRYFGPAVTGVAIADGNLYFGDSMGWVHALNAATGAPMWSSNSGDEGGFGYPPPCPRAGCISSVQASSIV